MTNIQATILTYEKCPNPTPFMLKMIEAAKRQPKAKDA